MLIRESRENVSLDFIFSDVEIGILDRWFEIFIRNFNNDEMPYPKEEWKNFLYLSKIFLTKLLKQIDIELSSNLEKTFKRFEYLIEKRKKYLSSIYFFILFSKLAKLPLKERKKWVDRLEEIVTSKISRENSWIDLEKDKWTRQILEKLKTEDCKTISNVEELSILIKNERNRLVGKKIDLKIKIEEILKFCFLNMETFTIYNLITSKKSVVSYIFFNALLVNLDFLNRMLTDFYFPELNIFEKMIVLSSLSNYCAMMPFVIKFLFFLAFPAIFPNLFIPAECQNNNPNEYKNLKNFINTKKFNHKVIFYLYSLYGFFVLMNDKDTINKLLKSENRWKYLKQISRPFKLFRRRYLEKIFLKFYEIDPIFTIQLLLKLYVNFKLKNLKKEQSVITSICLNFLSEKDLTTILEELDTLLEQHPNKNIKVFVIYEHRDKSKFTIKIKGFENIYVKLEKTEKKIKLLSLKTSNATAAETTTDATKVASTDYVVGNAKDFVGIDRGRERVKDTRARNVVKVHSHF